MQLYCETEGSGEPLVLLHAGVADLRMWDDQVAAFAARYRVIRYDAQGFGRAANMARAVIEHDADRKRAPNIDPPDAGRLAEIASPTLVIVGDADVRIVREVADILTAGIPAATSQLFPNAAHLLNLEYPAEFNAAVLSFLASHPLA